MQGLTGGFGRDGSPRSSRGVAEVDTARELPDTAVASPEAGSGCSVEKVPRLAGVWVGFACQVTCPYYVIKF